MGRIRSLIICYLCLQLLLSLQADIVIIAKKESGITSITKNELIKLYSGRGKNAGSKMVKPVLMIKGNNTHEEFCKKFLKRSGLSLSKIWKKLVFTGKARMPKCVDSDSEMLSYVASNDDVIGYTDRSNLNDNVITLKVE